MGGRVGEVSWGIRLTDDRSFGSRLREVTRCAEWMGAFRDVWLLAEV